MITLTPAAVQYQRYDTCRACEHSEIKNPDLVCNINGHLLLMKTRDAAESCPLNKWTVHVENT
jgi:hypothetical protein